MTVPSQFDPPTSSVARPVSWSQRLRRILLTILILWGVVVVMLASLQRSLIYLPHREARIKPSHAGLPAGQVHDIQIEADDGIVLHGWHILPEGRVAADIADCDRELQKGRPLVLYFSGNAGNRRYRMPEFHVLTSLDCDVFLFDYRGYGDNAGSPSEKHLTADARAVWNYATEHRRVDPQRILLYGESLGGGVAVALASETCAGGTPPAGVILRSTFSSLVDTGRYHYPWLPVATLLVDRFPSASLIPSVTCPILQLHGARDRIMPIELGRRLFDAAPDRSSGGIPKRFVELTLAGHNDVIFVAEEDLRRAIEDFLALL